MKTKNHHELGLTDEQFYGLVDFFRELIRLDENTEARKLRRNQKGLVQTLKSRIQELKVEKKSKLLRQLDGLESSKNLVEKVPVLLSVVI